jgi:hypothetical protein
MRAALRRVQQRRKEAAAAGLHAPQPHDVETLLSALRRAGLLGRRRLVIVAFDFRPADIERALWATGARSLAELVAVALLRMALGQDRRLRGGRRRLAPTGGTAAPP